MNDADKVQTWTHTTKIAAGHDWGRINTKTVEVVNFERGVVESHTTGIHEGERVDSRSSFEIDASATPESAAEYRRTRGYTRTA